MDEDSHSTDLSASALGCTWRRSFNNFIGSVGFYWGKSYLATLVTPQNCTKMLRNLTFIVQFAYFSIRPKKCFVFSSNFKQLSLQKATLNGFVKNVWATFWDILGNILENLEQLVESPALARAAWWSRLRRDNRYHSLHERFLNNQSAIGSGKGVSFYFFLI